MKANVNCLHVGHRHLANDALDLTIPRSSRDVGAHVFAVRRALRADL